MSSSASKWREEQILIVCPGSRTTMAQLGCSELTPPTHRVPTRMFKDGDGWRPYYTFQRKRFVDGVEEEEWVEDVDEAKGATWPIQGGRIVEMDAFLAFLDHVHGMLTTTYHNTPIVLMASPQWTRTDCETIARYIFEKTRTPALCLLHSGIATQYGLKSPHMTVIDIGYEKVDVTAIHDGRVVSHLDLGSPNPDRIISGGEVFTQNLFKSLQSKGFTYDMAEQLKKNPVCEVLPYAPGEESLMELPKALNPVGIPAAAAELDTSKSADSSILPPSQKLTIEENGENGEQAEDEGVLDVASIVTSGQTKEFLAKKEKEKEKGKRGAKPKDAEAATKAARLPNAKRTHNTFWYEQIVSEEVKPESPKAAPNEPDKPKQPAVAAPLTNPLDPAAPAVPASTTEGTSEPAAKTESETEAAGSVPDAAKPPETNGGEASKPVDGTGQPAAVDSMTEGPAKPEESNGVSLTAVIPAPPVITFDPPERKAKRVRRDIEVGLERFTFADRDEVDRIVNTIYRTIQNVEDMYMRPPCWDNLVFVGNGSRLRGLKDNILQTLNARHLISPSTATMFTSELPSNMATPTGTGSQTPTGSFTGAPHQLSTSGVNPLLQAATTASTLGVGQPNPAATPGGGGSETGGPTFTHHFHSQTPTSIKTITMPTYLSEWTKNGFEESMFLGAQVAARIAFCLHSNVDAQGMEAQRLMSLSRVDYNELGPKAIRTHSMLS